MQFIRYLNNFLYNQNLFAITRNVHDTATQVPSQPSKLYITFIN